MAFDRSTWWFAENTCSARAEEPRSPFFRARGVHEDDGSNPASFDCTEAEAPMPRKCYENLGEQGRYYQRLSYDVEGSVRRFSRDLRHKCSHNHRHACVQRNSFVDEGPIAADTLQLHAAVATTIWSTARRRSIKSRWRPSNRSRHTSTLQMVWLLMFGHTTCKEKTAV